MENSNAIIDAFQLTWGNYPGVVMLLNKKHTIVSLSKKAYELGLSDGGKCFCVGGNDKTCRWCKMAKAMKTQEAVRTVTYMKEKGLVYDSFWIPVSEEYFVHFGNDITPYVNVETLPEELVY